VSLAQSASRFDRENSGVISGQQLSSALLFLKFPISPQELIVIRDAYPGRARGSINWQTLCAEVDRPASSGTGPEAVIDSAGRPLPPNAIGDLVSKIASSATSAGIDLNVELSNLDARRTGSVPQDFFLKLIDKVPVQLSVAEIRPLLSFYRISGSSNVNYTNFLADIVALSSKPSPQRTKIPVVTQPIPTLAPATHELIKRFKAFCEERRIAPVDVFVPYDTPTTGTLASTTSRLSSGFLPGVRLLTAFTAVKFAVQKGEIEALQLAFRDLHRPDLFNYAAFLRALTIEEISTPESEPQAAVPVSRAIEVAARLAAGHIRENLLARHRNIDSAFAGLSVPTISAAEFQSRLAKIGLVLVQGQIQALIRRYRVNLTDQIDWKAFVADVKESKTVGD
jgi:Ca2+-binding EF-hand superfamily protein